jgi:nucleotide-binding universal stress UspA family protein
MCADITAENDRTFLLVADDTPELLKALRYACRRAKRTGGKVAMLYVIPQIEAQQWASVGDLMRKEARDQAEEVLHRFSELVVSITGNLPRVVIREGDTREQLLKTIDEDPSISVLVLGADTGQQGPGPLVSALSGKYAANLRVPLTIVPGSLTDAQIDSIS